MSDLYARTIDEVMQLCVDKAKDTVNNGIGGPFGAAIIKYNYEYDNYNVICVETNSVIKDNDPTAHAEVNAIRKACSILGTFDLSNYMLVTTGQSCPMCISATIWSNIQVVYYGTTYDDATKIGFRDEPIFEHLNGKKKMVNEIPCCRDTAIQLHKLWQQKQDRVDY